LSTLRGELDNGTLGDVYRIRNPRNCVIFRVREAASGADVIDSSGNPEADAVWTFIKTNTRTATPRRVCLLERARDDHASQQPYGNALAAGAEKDGRPQDHRG
jgi:hypothetical protein